MVNNFPRLEHYTASNLKAQRQTKRPTPGYRPSVPHPTHAAERSRLYHGSFLIIFKEFLGSC